MQLHGTRKYVGDRVEVRVREVGVGGDLIEAVTGRVAKYDAASGAILVLQERTRVDQEGDGRRRDVPVLGTEDGWRWFQVGSNVSVESEAGEVWDACDVTVRRVMESSRPLTFTRLDVGMRLAVDFQNPMRTRFGTI